MKNFTSTLPYTSLEDERFMQNKEVLRWSVRKLGRGGALKNGPNQLREKQIAFIRQASIWSEINDDWFRTDMQYFIWTESWLSMSVLSMSGCQCLSMSGCLAVRSLSMFLNSDLLENSFCQARGGNGQNSNPTYSQYGPTMNSILLGQTSSTTKSNTGETSSFSFSRPKKS